MENQKVLKLNQLINNAYECFSFMEFYELKKQLQATQQKTNKERLENLLYFFDNITATTEGKERNDLYRTIVECILYQREGNNINIKITFK